MIELKAITEDEDEIEMAMTLDLKMIEPADEYEQAIRSHRANAGKATRSIC